jgi:hypothetical protein
MIAESIRRVPTQGRPIRTRNQARLDRDPNENERALRIVAAVGRPRRIVPRPLQSGHILQDGGGRVKSVRVPDPVHLSQISILRGMGGEEARAVAGGADDRFGRPDGQVQDGSQPAAQVTSGGGGVASHETRVAHQRQRGQSHELPPVQRLRIFRRRAARRFRAISATRSRPSSRGRS